MTQHLFVVSMVIVAWTAVAIASDPVGNETLLRSVDTVIWPEGDIVASGPIPDGPLSNADQSYLPVLLPANFVAYRSLALVADPYTYSASVHGVRYRASITGTRVSFGQGSDTPANGRSIQSGLSEQSAYATFIRYGVAYRVEVECDRPFVSDCETTVVAERLARSVALFGGRKGEPSRAETAYAAAPLPEPLPPDPLFDFDPPGQLTDSKGEGVKSETIFAPGIRFPVEKRRAFLNSQVWGIGGGEGQKGSWLDVKNHRYPWRDTFCEHRSRATLACPAGKGHQGVDIRADQPEKGKSRRYWAVATEDGRILSIGSYSVTLLGASGRQYRYLHMQNPVAVKVGQQIARGQRMGLISNSFGGTPTTIHLHFEILQNVRGQGFRHVPPYMSLVRAYQSFG